MAITCPDCGRQYDATLFEFDRRIQCDCGRVFGISEGHRLTVPPRIAGVLIDIAGVLYVGDEAIPGAVEALRRLRDSGLPVRYLTNTTRTTRQGLLARLSRLGFDLEPSNLFTAPLAALQYVRQRGLRPYLLIHPDLRAEFDGVDCRQPNAVVVGDAGDGFHYRALNEAFRVLIGGGRLVGMGNNRYFRTAEGLSLDMGPFIEALRYASGVEPVIVGKPSAEFFQQALEDMGITASEAVMIGDDLQSDVGGAQDQGIRGILVRTGKYRAEDERNETIRPRQIVADLPQAIEWILDRPGS